MKIETNKRDLEAVLNLVGVAKGAGKPDSVVTHVCFQSDGSAVEIRASDMRISARGPLTGDVDGEGAFTVELWRLTKWLGTMKEGTVTLDFSGGSVAVSGSNSRIVLQSLNPAEFPPMPMLGDVDDASEVDAKRIHGLLSYLRSFILEDETLVPHYNLTEVKNGAFWATNQKALVILTVPELANTQLRIHKLDLKGVLAFIAACGTRAIKFVERLTGDEQGFFIVHPGGTSLFVPRPRKEFPDLAPQLTLLQTDGCVWWEVSPTQLNSSIEALTASADSENYLVRLSAVGSDLLEVSIRSAFGSEDSTAKVPAKIRAKQSVHLPEGKLAFHHPSLVAALAKIKDEVAALEVFASPDDGKKGRVGGLARLVYKTKDGDEIHTILHWVLH